MQIPQYYSRERLTPTAGNAIVPDNYGQAGNAELQRLGGIMTEIGAQYAEQFERAEANNQFNQAKVETLKQIDDYKLSLLENPDTDTYESGFDAAKIRIRDATAKILKNKNAQDAFQNWYANAEQKANTDVKFTRYKVAAKKMKQDSIDRRNFYILKGDKKSILQENLTSGKLRIKEGIDLAKTDPNADWTDLVEPSPGNEGAFVDFVSDMSKIDELNKKALKQQQKDIENSVLATAKEEYRATKDFKKAVNIVESSKDVPEDKKTGMVRDLKFYSELTQAEEKKQKDEEQLSESNAIVKYYASDKIEDLEAGYEYTKNSKLEPDEKRMRLDDFRTRIKALKEDAANDPLKEYDTETYLKFLQQSIDPATFGNLDETKLANAVGKGKKGGISDTQFKYLAGTKELTIEQRTLRTYYQSVLSDMHKRYGFSLDPGYNDTLHAQAAAYLDEWIKANPKATSDDYAAQISRLQEIPKNPTGWTKTSEKTWMSEQISKMRKEIPGSVQTEPGESGQSVDDLSSEIKTYYPKLNPANRAKMDAVIQSGDPVKINKALTILRNTYK